MDIIPEHSKSGYLDNALTVLPVASLLQSRGAAVHSLIRYHIRMLYVKYSLDSGNCR